MKIFTLRKNVVFALIFGALTLGIGVYAATNLIIATGTMQYYEPFGGPATVTMRTLTFAPNETLPWHYHPGIGAFTVVKTGSIAIEDGCGGERYYNAGDAFLEFPNRVHRGRNLTDQEAITAQTFVVPAGMTTTIPTGTQMCGQPRKVEECKNEGWRTFDFPRSFKNQGDCVGSVNKSD